MHRNWIKSALWAALVFSAAPAAGSDESEEPHSQYRVLEWNDLVAPVESLPPNLRASMGSHWELTQ